jgi:hypothetical protein
MSADGARSGGTFFLFICLPAGITIIACGDEIPLALGLQPARLFYLYHGASDSLLGLQPALFLRTIILY